MFSDDKSNDEGFFGSFWTKVAHGFAPAIVEGETCQIYHEGSNGVSIEIEKLNKSFGDHHVL